MVVNHVGSRVSVARGLLLLWGVAVGRPGHAGFCPQVQHELRGVPCDLSAPQSVGRVFPRQQHAPARLAPHQAGYRWREPGPAILPATGDPCPGLRSGTNRQIDRSDLGRDAGCEQRFSGPPPGQTAVQRAACATCRFCRSCSATASSLRSGKPSGAGAFFCDPGAAGSPPCAAVPGRIESAHAKTDVVAGSGAVAGRPGRC